MGRKGAPDGVRGGERFIAAALAAQSPRGGEGPLGGLAIVGEVWHL